MKIEMETRIDPDRSVRLTMPSEDYPQMMLMQVGVTGHAGYVYLAPDETKAVASAIECVLESTEAN